MEIELLKPYMSLSPFKSEGLPDFVIITGKNGSGKTQLVALLKKNVKKDFSTGQSPVLLVRSDGNLVETSQGELAKINLSGWSDDQWKESIRPTASEFVHLSAEFKELAQLLMQNHYWIDNLVEGSFIKSLENIPAEEVKEKVVKFVKRHSGETQTSYGVINNYNDYEEACASFAGWQNNRYALEVANHISLFTGKDLIDIEESDFYLTPLPNYIADSRGFHHVNLESTFYNYAKRRDQNKRRFFDRKEYQVNNGAVSDNQFIDRYPPPWDLANQILKKCNLGFRFNGIDHTTFHPPANYIFEPIKNLNTGIYTFCTIINRRGSDPFYNLSIIC